MERKSFCINPAVAVMFFGVVVALGGAFCLYWNVSFDNFVPFFKDFKCENNVLVVRSAYSTYIVPALMFFLPGVYQLLSGIISFFGIREHMKRKRGALLGKIFGSFFLIGMGAAFFFCLPHTYCSLRRDAKKIYIDSSNHWKITAGVRFGKKRFTKKYEPRMGTFDRRCFNFVAPYDFEFPSLPKDLSKEKNGIYASLNHVHGCCCFSKAKKQCISAQNFPFNSAVLLNAVARGVVDTSSDVHARAWVSVR